MSAPDDAAREQPAVAPTVSTAPPPTSAPRWWSAIPKHLGRARTSTLVLSVLFLAIFALYLNVRPDEARTTTTGDPAVTEPAPVPGGTTAPAPTTAVPTTTVAPTTTETTTSTTPTETTAPEQTTTSLPTPTLETTTVPPPTTTAPTG